MFISEEWVTIFSLHDDKTTPHFWDHIIFLALVVKYQSASAEDMRCLMKSLTQSLGQRFHIKFFHIKISYKSFYLSMLKK